MFFWRVGRFPSVFKFADIVPVPKSSKPTSPSDFRPISILPVLSKIMEKIVVAKLILPNLCSKLSPSQFAYIPGSHGGTTSALTLVSHHILKFLDSKSGAVRVVAADFSKAFDRLPFGSILSSLVKFGLSRQAVLFLADFLSGRKQRVRFGGLFSEWSTITSGVPQGSVVGPILFTIVIDSLSPLCDNSVYVKYADDVTVLHFVRSKDDDMLQNEWSHIENWSRSVGLHLNYSKCVVMNCVTKKSLDLCSIRTAEDNVLASVSSLRLLGVTFSSDLTWNVHVEEIVKKCYRRFFILRNLKRASCPPFLIHRCYVLFIRSLLLYSFSSFCNLPEYLFYRLVQVEKRAAKFFPAHEHQALPLTAELMCNKLFNKILNSLDHPLRVMFQPRAPTPRNQMTLMAPFTKTSRFYKSFIRFGRL